MKRIRWNPDKYSEAENCYAVLVRPLENSMRRQVPMGRVKHVFSVDEDDTEYDDKVVVIIGPDKRGVMDMIADGVFPMRFVEYTIDLCDERDDPDNAWTVDDIVQCLDRSEYMYIFVNDRSSLPHPPGLLCPVLTREERAEMAYKSLKARALRKQAAENQGKLVQDCNRIQELSLNCAAVV